MLPEPGSLFDRYRIEAILGEGGMGRVYRAFDERLHRRVALKVLRLSPGSSLGDSRDGEARLLREARLAAALDHPNAVAIFDVGEARLEGDPTPLPYIAMELIVGRTLRAFIGVAEVSLAERIRWLTDAARALAAAHRSGLVHRDVKPENVMVRDDGVLKVLDFGIARRSPTGSIDSNAATQPLQAPGTLTADGVVVGTPFYMAPEQMRGEPLSGAADQFSWGVVAYELLSGELPWDKTGDGVKLVAQVLTMPAPRLRDVAPDVPFAVEGIVMRALSKVASERLASMDEVVLLLDALGPRATNPPGLPSTIETLGTAPTIQSTKTSLATAGSQQRAPGVASATKRRWGGFGIALVVLAAVAAISRLSGSRSGTRSGPAVDAAQLGPVALTDLPSPTTNPQALSAYREGMHALRRGDLPVATGALERAVELDPQLAPASLRLAAGLLFHHPAVARKYFRKATEGKGALTIRDRALLDAFIPAVTTDPPDVAETRARLAAMMARYPLDAEVALDLGVIDVQLLRYDDAVREFDRALELDPDYSYAAVGKAACSLLKGDMDAVIAASKQCERSAPGVSMCVSPRLLAEQEGGQCKALLDDSRRLILSSPDAEEGYLAGAQALYALGSPVSAVRESVSQARARMGDRARWPRASLLLELDLEVLQGNFAEGEKLALQDEADPQIRSSSDGGLRAMTAWARIEIALESGQPGKAADIAADYLARSQAWSPPLYVVDEPQFEHRIMMLALLARMKRATSAEVEAERAKRIESADTKADPLARGYLWYGNYARPASTPEEAKLALSVLPEFAPLPLVWGFPADAAIGEVYRLAGQLDDAIVRLKRAASECNAINYPFDSTRANFALGRALEANKDVAGACTAYKVVVARWGSAKPRSVTGDAARARIAALACP